MPSLKELPKGAVRIGYGKFKDKYEAEEAELKAWLALPLSERLERMGLPKDFDPKMGIKK